jgi:hypothetical protein
MVQGDARHLSSGTPEVGFMVAKLNSLIPSSAPGAMPVRPSIAPKGDPASDDTPSVEPVEATVKLSGRAMMLSRLFRTTDPGAEPPVAVSPASPDESLYPFLQQQDREVLAKAYDFATEKGIDPSSVDAVARDLAAHRSSSVAPDMLEGLESGPVVGADKSAELARAVTAYRMMPGSPQDRERYFAGETSRILQTHLSSGGSVDFEFVRRLLTQPGE